MWQYQNTDELYHHGVPGQRWGIRRYQNADGTLTPLGRKKAGKLAEKYANVTGKKLIVKKKSVDQRREKSIGEMSSKELQEKINRMRLEDTYKSMMTSRAPKEKVSVGKRFVSTITNKVIIPGAIEGSKRVVSNLVDQAIGRAVQKKKGDIFGTTYLSDKNKNTKTVKTVDTVKDSLNITRSKTDLGTYDVSKKAIDQLKRKK